MVLCLQGSGDMWQPNGPEYVYISVVCMYVYSSQAQQSIRYNEQI